MDLHCAERATVSHKSQRSAVLPRDMLGVDRALGATG